MKNKCEMCKIEFGGDKRKNTKYCHECRLIKNKEIHKKYRDSNKEKRHAYDKEYRKTHKDEIANRMVEYNKIYKQNHRDERKEYRKNKKADINYRIERDARSKLHTFFKSKNNNLYSDLIGCSLTKFKKWLEYNFIGKMNWSNYGVYWHMDHVIPVCIFDLSDDKNLKFCFNWKNTRPLEATINVSRKYSYSDILIHELKTHFFSRQNVDEITNLNYGVSNLQNYTRNRLMGLVNR